MVTKKPAAKKVVAKKTAPVKKVAVKKAAPAAPFDTVEISEPPKDTKGWKYSINDEVVSEEVYKQCVKDHADWVIAQAAAQALAEKAEAKMDKKVDKKKSKKK